MTQRQTDAHDMGAGLRLPACIALVAAALLATACQSGSISDGLRPVASVGSGQQRPVPAGGVGSETALAPQQPVATSPNAALRDGGQTASLSPSVPPVVFLPVTGAPQSAVTNLATSMRAAAKSEAIPVVASLDRGATYQIKGYFSALNDGAGTILVYVWDILDQNGTRVHRISGQERGSRASGDPWGAITPEILERVAWTTMNGLHTWMTTRGSAG